MSSKSIIEVRNLGKCYEIYNEPRDRLKQYLAQGIAKLGNYPSKKYYREFWALQNVSFDIGKGETVGIIGQNGSGKSTLLQLICGTLRPTTGEATVQGRIAALLELGAGFNPEFTGRENAYLNAAILGIPREAMESRMQDVLDFSELGDFLEQPVKTYSSGMYARLAFAVAIHVDPEILIVDEALAVGDARFTAKCMRRIKDIQAKGSSILFVSHDVGSVRTLCQRAIWINQGELIEDGDVFPVTGRYTAYMFRDELADEQATQIADVNAGMDSPTTGLPQTLVEENTLKPITHWGSRVGIIKSAEILDEHLTQKNVFSWGEQLKVVMEVDIPKNLPLENISLAFSIKDLKGTDLIVSTTHDFEKLNFTEDGKFKVLFEFKNHLTEGKYLLVVAVENRQHRDIHYYEYIEGAQYFASESEHRLFGLFQPSIKKSTIQLAP
ncbi:ABC transporter ATP-binding protein [Comamonas sp.]|uniref:ABC transporter ATP-binding protein n=1 Tax=Comamonas sp. TaxID=34028 RepID=UPI0028968D51|nr:ABC transporter ATP-binding protein [Comamonas sp.]